ncbi:hypothetical protein LRC484719_42660 [Mycobacterium riyadhense]
MGTLASTFVRRSAAHEFRVTIAPRAKGIESHCCWVELSRYADRQPLRVDQNQWTDDCSRGTLPGAWGIIGWISDLIPHFACGVVTALVVHHLYPPPR